MTYLNCQAICNVAKSYEKDIMQHILKNCMILQHTITNMEYSKDCKPLHGSTMLRAHKSHVIRYQSDALGMENYNRVYSNTP